MLVAMMALMLLAGLQFAALSVGTYTVTPSTLKPGEEGAITFSVENVAPTGGTASQLEDVQVYFGGTASGVEFLTKSPFVIGTIDSGGSAVVSVPFRVLPNARGGVVTAPFYISQKDKSDLKTVNVVIKVVNPPILSLSSDKQTVSSTEEVQLTITNNGGAADRLTLKISNASKFSLGGTSEVYFGRVEGNKTVAVQLDSRDATEGINSVPFVLSYQQEGGDSVTETKTLSITVKKEKADVVFSQAEPLVTSQNGILKLGITNTGRMLEDFEVNLADESIKANENRQAKLGTLPAGAERTVSFAVFADVEPGVRSVQLLLKWVEDDVEKEETVTVPIIVTSDAEAAIYIVAKPAPLVTGGDHTLSVTVSNLGSYRIQNVEVTLAPSDAVEIFDAQRSQYIGGLDSDDFSSVSYRVRVKAAQPGTYPLTVNVRYKDQSGAWIEKDQTIELAIRSPADLAPQGSGDGTLVTIGLLAVVAGAGYWYFRMRKKPAAPAQKR